MDYDLTLYQVSPRLAETVIARIGEFNRGRTTVNGCYAISVATAYRPYYAFWRFFPNVEIPLFIRTLAVTFDMAAERAFSLLQNCNVKLEVFDNRVLNAIMDNRKILFLSESTVANDWLKCIILILLTYCGWQINLYLVSSVTNHWLFWPKSLHVFILN